MSLRAVTLPPRPAVLSLLTGTAAALHQLGSLCPARTTKGEPCGNRTPRALTCLKHSSLSPSCHTHYRSGCPTGATGSHSGATLVFGRGDARFGGSLSAPVPGYVNRSPGRAPNPPGCNSRRAAAAVPTWDLVRYAPPRGGGLNEPPRWSVSRPGAPALHGVGSPG